MAVSQSLVFSCPIPKLLSEKNPKVSTFGRNYENMKSLKLRSHGKIGVNINGYTYFTSPLHPLESEMHVEIDSEIIDSGGIGILEFFQGKNIFITGATGLVGKAFLEKLLRSTCVGKIYVLMKAEDKEVALDRLSKEIINSELFECLREKHGSSYEEFVRGKLIPVVGNICEPNLGMDTYSSRAIMADVDVIIQSAASTTLNDRYDMLLDANTRAPQRLMRFAKTCKKVKLFVHISTAFVNGRKEGVIVEKPLTMGENGKNENGDHEVSSSLFPQLDVNDEMELAMKSCKACTDYDVTKDLKRLGAERAAFFGYYNAYHMTKAMGEMVLNEIRGDTPLLIIRPTVIESIYKEPLPGWMQGNRVYDPVIMSYGKGQLPAYLCDPNVHMDIVPLDMVINTTIAAIAKHGVANKPQVNVYHVGTEMVNPLRFSEFFEYLYEYFSGNPVTSSESISKMKLFSEFNDFSKYVRDEISERSGMKNAVGVNGRNLQKIQRQYKAKVAYAEQLCKMYEFSGFFKARFDTRNTQKLLEEMSKEEQDGFEIDATKIDWRKYFVEIHIRGFQKYVLNRIRESA